MFDAFHALADRIKALFVADMALDLEAQLVSRQADRQAELLLQAEQHDRHGFPGVAARLREHAQALSLARPLAGVLPALEHWQADDRDAGTAPAQSPQIGDHNHGDGRPGRAARLPSPRRKDR